MNIQPHKEQNTNTDVPGTDPEIDLGAGKRGQKFNDDGNGQNQKEQETSQQQRFPGKGEPLPGKNSQPKENVA